jgi:glucose-6-phosphate dehydrogenase assembly protein OpcA
MSTSPPPGQTPAVLEQAGEPVAVESVEHALARQEKALQSNPEAPVQRARMSNLVVYCDSAERAAEVAAALPAVAALHPARVLLLLAEPDVKPAGLTARVCVRTHGAGEGHTVLTEQITLHATGQSVQRLPFAVRSLVVGDLPINLWWATPQAPPLGGVLFHDLAENTEQVLYDSIGWPQPARGVVSVASWLAQLERGPHPGRWRVASDVNWRRLKYWRRLLAQSLAPASAPGILDAVTEVVLEHGPHAVVQAWELVSWLASRLGWKVQGCRVQPGVEIQWNLDGPQGLLRLRLRRLEKGPAAIQAMHITASRAGKAQTLRLACEEEGCRLMAILEGTGSAPRTMTVPPQPLAELVGRQLPDRERDPVFRASMAVARVLAESVLDHV